MTGQSSRAVFLEMTTLQALFATGLAATSLAAASVKQVCYALLLVAQPDECSPLEFAAVDGH